MFGFQYQNQMWFLCFIGEFQIERNDGSGYKRFTMVTENNRGYGNREEWVLVSCIARW